MSGAGVDGGFDFVFHAGFMRVLPVPVCLQFRP